MSDADNAGEVAETKPKTKAKGRATRAPKKEEPKEICAYFAFGRPNQKMSVPTGDGGSEIRNPNGFSPVVKFTDPVMITALRYNSTHAPGQYRGQWMDHPELKEVAGMPSDDVLGMLRDSDGKFNTAAYRTIFANQERIVVED